MTALEEIKKALAAAEQFIVNGVELGYIRMPNPETPDSAHDTLPMIRQAQSALESLQRENEELRKDREHVAAEKSGIAKNAHSNVDYWKSQFDAAEAEVKRLRQALKPFAEYKTADGYSGTDFLRIKDEHPILFRDLGSSESALTVGDFRRARTALASTGG